MKIYKIDKKIVLEIIFVFLVLIITITTVVLMLKKNKVVNIADTELSVIQEESINENIFEQNISKNENTTIIVELDMNDIPQDKPTGYIPDQNLVKDNFIPFSERDSEPVYNYDISNVTLEIVEGSLTKTGLIIQITDKNETKYAWGEDFLLQIKNDDGEWVLSKYIPKNSWYEVPWNLNSDGIGLQTVSMNGEFEEGRQYRIVKRTYDNNKQEYVEVSVEFEI